MAKGIPSIPVLPCHIITRLGVPWGVVCLDSVEKGEDDEGEGADERD